MPDERLAIFSSMLFHRDSQLMSRAAHILLIEDDASLATNLRDVLQEDGFQVTVCDRGDEGMRRANNDECDVVLTDLRLPGLGGLDLVRQLHDTQPRLPVVLMTAHGTIETAIEATKLGAYDYLQKPFDMPGLISVLHRAVEASRLMREPVTLPDAPVESRTALVGTGRAMQDVCKEIGRVAAKPVTVLIRGETGTGKELIARAIYQHSPRAKAPFIAINCAAIPENLLESELFGHERGAFTGADQRRIGRFEQANKGSLFLDEIGDLPAHTQVKLLRVLQQQTFQRVGGSEAISVDVRIIADAVRQTFAARNAETAPAGRSFTAFAGDLLIRAQKSELQDAHARMLAEAEREILTQAITLAEGNQAKAARWLGLSRFTLREKLKQLGLHPDSTGANSETEG